LRLNSGMQWIEMIDWLFYALAIAPLMWLIGAYIGVAGNPASSAGSWRRWLRMLIMGVSLAAIGFIASGSGRLVPLLVCIAAAVLLLFIDLFATEAAHRSN